MTAPSLILPNEKQLFIQVAAGDQTAFSEIFYHYASRIYPFIKKMVRSETIAEDLTQDVFVQLWKHRLSLATVSNYKSYIFSVAANITYNHLKVKAREIKGLNEITWREDDFSNQTQELLDLHESQAKINDLIEQLSPQKKLIYKLTREEGLSHEQIAQRLNISKNTVKNHLTDTLKFLRDNLQRSKGSSLVLISIWVNIYS